MIHHRNPPNSTQTVHPVSYRQCSRRNPAQLSSAPAPSLAHAPNDHVSRVQCKSPCRPCCRYLWNEFEFRYGIGVGDEGQTGATLNNASHIGSAGFEGQIAEYAKCDAAGDDGGARIHRGDDHNIFVDVP
uniref:Uncharacterized protein n=1 Tax=Bactrocera dorsalis TaxID=27457 RepID=A0A034VSI5_BACDO